MFINKQYPQYLLPHLLLILPQYYIVIAVIAELNALRHLLLTALLVTGEPSFTASNIFHILIGK